MKEAPEKVIIRQYRSGRKEMIAIFPEMPFSANGYTCGGYVIVGQHCEVDTLTTIPLTRLVKNPEATEIAKELVRIGYKLKFCKRVHRNALEYRRVALKAMKP